MKTCTKCSILKNFSDFHRKSSVKDGYAHWCKICVKAYDNKEHDSKRVFPVKVQNGLIHCRRCERYLDKSSFWKTNTYCKDCSKLIGHSANLKRFGMTVDDYITLEKSQNGVCAICKNPEQNKNRLSVDHNHACCPGTTTCGKCVRGLLCSNCNTFLGNAKDSIDILKNAITYLQGK
jgi:hypothetical protein